MMVPEIARRAEVCDNTVYRAIRKGKLRAELVAHYPIRNRYLPKRYFLHVREVEALAWINERLGRD